MAFAADLLEQHTVVRVVGSGATFSTDSVAEVFEELAARWHDETKFSSDTGEITSNENYRRVIALGRAAVPWILHDLRTRGGDWFAALEAITGDSPVSDDDLGFPQRMKDAWFQWGKARGYRA